MSPAFSMMLMTSVVGLGVGVMFMKALGSPARRFMLGTLILGLALVIYRSLPPGGVEAKGPVNDAIAIVCCYAAMVLGMVAQYFYRQADRGARRLTIKPTEFLMPIFASPIVFIPLLTIIADVSLTGTFTKANLMVYLIAFQNGFFWKSFFDQLRPKGAVAVASSA